MSSPDLALSDLSDFPVATEFNIPATDGEMVTVWHHGTIETMPTHGRVVNGYLEGIDGFDKHCDGDVVVECGSWHPCAMTWADAHQELHRDIDDFSARVHATEILREYSTREQVLARIHPKRTRVLAVVLHLVDGAMHPDVARALKEQDAKPLSYNPFKILGK